MHRCSCASGMDCALRKMHNAHQTQVRPGWEGTLTYFIGVEIGRRQMSRNFHAAAIGHVEPEAPALRGVHAGVRHLPGVVVKHDAANARKYFIRWWRSELEGVFCKFIYPRVAGQDARRKLVQQLPEVPVQLHAQSLNGDSRREEGVRLLRLDARQVGKHCLLPQRILVRRSSAVSVLRQEQHEAHALDVS